LDLHVDCGWRIHLSGSLFGRLNLTEGVGDRLAQAQRDLTSNYTRLDLLTLNPRQLKPLQIKVAVVGGGFAGLAAASVLQNLQLDVHLFEARSEVGGRVETTSSLFTSPPSRTLERGAELIGRSHRTWIRLAKHLGLGLSVITDEDMFEGMDLFPQLGLGGRILKREEVDKLAKPMKAVLEKLVRTAEIAFHVPYHPSSTTVFEPWLEPWRVPGIGYYDKQTLGSWIRDSKNTPSRPASLLPALIYGLSNDMAIDIDKLSLLAMLTHIAGGGFGRYWVDREVYRCEDGNQVLATKLALRLEEGCPPATVHRNDAVTSIKVVGPKVVVTSQGRPGGDAYDFLVLAVPPSVWSGFSVDNWQLPKPIQSGPAVKYLAAVGSRYWVPKGSAPSSNDDSLGQLWESTDNQTGGGNIGLTVFAGGQYAERVGKSDPKKYFADGIEKLLPGARDPKKGLLPQHQYVDWPKAQYIETGYSAPAVGEVTGLQQEMHKVIGGRIFLAGEHVSPPYFGFMEGALQSGIKAAERLASRANELGARIPIPEPPRESPRDTRGVDERPRLKCRGTFVA